MPVMPQPLVPAGRWMLAAGCWMPGAGCWPLAAGCSSRRPRQARAAQGEPEQPEERRWQEEARVPLVVAGGAARLVDLALLQRVEHRVQAALQRLLVGG